MNRSERWQLNFISANIRINAIIKSKMEKKQSSVDWLVENLMKGEFINSTDELIEQAKAMHKKEIEDSWLDGVGNWDSEKEAEQYYTKTFGGQDERDRSISE